MNKEDFWLMICKPFLYFQWLKQKKEQEKWNGNGGGL
jgi:predicted RNA-binding protein with PUA-like domain